MSCISTVFSTYGGGARGYSLQSYSSIRFYDGSYGPAEPPINMSSFREKAAWTGGGGGTQTFTASGTFTVPTGVTSLNVELRGAMGVGGDTPAFGGFVSGTLAVTSGAILQIIVNEGGGTATGTGRTGGGFAAIANNALSTYYVIAGGGGGTNAGSGSFIYGGDGGGTTAGNGENDGTVLGGGGGSQSAGGAGGVFESGENGYAGSSRAGGAGATSGGGGGGGGYFGGGGGAYYIDRGTESGGGGGGGSSYVDTLTGTVINTKGGNSTIANGNVVLTWT